MSLQTSSSFRHSGQRDDRRRRLLTDELANATDWPASEQASQDDLPPQKTAHYGDAPFLEQQPRLLDFVPCRLVSHVILLTVGAAIIAGLGFSYHWMLERVANGGAAVAATRFGRQRQPGLLVFVALAAGGLGGRNPRL